MSPDGPGESWSVAKVLAVEGGEVDNQIIAKAIRWKLMIDYLWIKQSMDVSRNLSAVKRLPNYALNVL